MADRYWVGGTDSWNATAGTKWALTSGGAGGEAVPTAADDVYFDANSGAVTVTVGVTSNCQSLSFTSGAGDYAGTFAGTPAVNISGGMTISATTTWTHTGTLSFLGASSYNINTNGVSLNNALTFNNATGAWTFQGAVTTGSTRAITLTSGSLYLNGYTLTGGSFINNNANVRLLDFGATGEIVLLNNGAVIWNGSNATNFSSAGNKVVKSTYAGATGTRTFNFGLALTESSALKVFITAGTDTVSLQSNYFDIDTTGFTGTLSGATRNIYGSLTIGAGATYAATANSTSFIGTSGSHVITTNGVTIDGPLVFNGLGGSWAFADALTQGSTRNFTFTNGTVKLKNGVTSTVGNFLTSGTTQKFLQSSLAGSQATLSQASGTVNATFLTIKDINATGGATWNAFTSNNNVDAGNNTGWDFFTQLGKYIYTRRKNKRILLN